MESEIYKGTLVSADFEEGTIEFEIEGQFIVRAGKYIIIREEECQKNSNLMEQNKRMKHHLKVYLIYLNSLIGAISGESKFHKRVKEEMFEIEQLLQETQKTPDQTSTGGE